MMQLCIWQEATLVYAKLVDPIFLLLVEERKDRVPKEQDDLKTHSSIDPLYELLNVDYGKVEM